MTRRACAATTTIMIFLFRCDSRIRAKTLRFESVIFLYHVIYKLSYSETHKYNTLLNTTWKRAVDNILNVSHRHHYIIGNIIFNENCTRHSAECRWLLVGTSASSVCFEPENASFNEYCCTLCIITIYGNLYAVTAASKYSLSYKLITVLKLVFSTAWRFDVHYVYVQC